MSLNTSRAKRLFVLLLLLTVSAAPARACSIPVFRYALERWPPSDYEVIVFHKGPLSAEEQDVLAWLKKSAVGDGGSANLVLRTVDVSGEAEESMLKIWERHSSNELPWFVMRYPSVLQIKEDAWSGPFSKEAALRIVDSPVRQEIGRRILSGDSVVWVLLESGDATKDAEAAKALEAALKEGEKTIELPQPLDVYADESEADESETAPPARPVFSIVRLSRSDPAERVFVNMLLPEGPQRRAIAEAVTFPIFGRGRVLCAFPGKEINEDSILGAARFISGPCSCQVKDSNPGMDLLMAVDWEAGIGERVVEDVPLPSLASLPAVVSEAREPTVAAPAPPPATAQAGRSLMYSTLLAAGAGLLVLAGAAWVLKSRKR
ncbi:MAG: hypothetical protein QGD94_10355 [Planctomycetia bacterium]|nr:hypothetical protein [Planctomycetia bacterium]